ncbi:MAG: N(4)-(beta-N-acetylglucosaminyl)-L-asparaginase [Reichenbachiella sp.]|uniref:isoaspartyl peptidase/L-asparaginase family protein n=1 Tax=Reichenbachiella sp. TaxID=2184521 RepID=UPI0032651A38
MSKDRRDFLKLSALGMGAVGGTVLTSCLNETSTDTRVEDKKRAKGKPVVLSTWNHGIPANEAAWNLLKAGKGSLDAIEAGARVVESDPKVRTVGKGGYPDREGKVTLDACIMAPDSGCGSVAFLQEIENPISVARKVMEETPHVMMVGEGALQFALEQGFEKTNLLTEEAKKDWQDWLRTSEYKPKINIENHDTIGLLAIDAEGNLSGGCTTSGAAWKLHGRVGDSPIIGAGLFLDNEVGAACATGLGEAVVRVAGSAMVVEMMRMGMSPSEACKQVVQRIYDKHRDVKDLQVGFIALDKAGNYGGYSLHPGFNYAICNDSGGNRMEDAKSILTKK